MQTMLGMLRKSKFARLAVSALRNERSPLPEKLKWRLNTKSEVAFWDDVFRTKGLHWPDDYPKALDADFPLQPRPAALLPVQNDVHILDVGAGPLTYLGKKTPGKLLKITAVDPLAGEYDKILVKYGVEPIVRTQRLAAEDLGKRYAANTFDFAYARNCLDHAYNPERAVLQMVEVVKPGCYVLLEHHPHEAQNAGYQGLHHWNFDMSPGGDFLIQSVSSGVNMTKKYADRCAIFSELLKENGEDWLIVRILKK